jgi:hypothetical protein
VSAPRLRPLGIGEILDVAIKIYWRHARVLLPLVAIVVLPAQVVLNLVGVSAGNSAEDLVVTGPTGEEELATDELGTLIAGVVVAGLIALLSTAIATGAAFKAVAEAYLGRTPHWRDSLAFVLRRLHSVIWLSILSALVIGLGLLLCVIPGVYLGVAFTVAVPVLLVEGLRGRRALGRSRRLVRGRWWPTLALVVLGTLLSGIVSFAIQGLVSAATLTDAGSQTLAAFLVGTIGGTLSATLTTPFQAAYTTVLYFDLRVRKEAFDLQLLAETIGVEPGEGAWAALEEPAPAEGSVEQPPFWPPPPGWRAGGTDSE